MKRRWADRIAGILVGVLIGVGVLVYFVFVHSEGTIDAPNIDGSGGGGSATGNARGGSTSPEPTGSSSPGPGRRETTDQESKVAPLPVKLPVVKVIGGAPPTASGPKQLTFRVGEEVRFEIDTNEPFSFEIRGLGIEKTIESSSIISFRAKRAGQFPVLATATLIGVADLLVRKKASG